MRQLKIPGRIIGREISQEGAYTRYFCLIAGRYVDNNVQYRFKDDTYLPIVELDQNPIVKMANVLQTLWESPWANDPKLRTRLGSTDVDSNGRGRDGLLVKQPIPDEYYVRQLAMVYFLTLSVGVLSDSSVFPKGRNWPWGGLTVTKN